MKKNTIVFAAATFLVLLFTSPSRAETIAIDNYSFENASGYWAEASGKSVWIDKGCTLPDGGSFNASALPLNTAEYTGFDGSNVLVIHADPGTSGTLSGTAWVGSSSLGVYKANTIYTLTVAVASPANYSTCLNSVIALGTDGSNIDSALASTTTNFGSLSQTAFKDITLTLDTSVVTDAAGKNIAILLEHKITPDARNGRDVYYDNVRLTALPAPKD